MSLKKKIIFQTAFETYTATEIIGQGGSGYVYKCHDANGNLFAAKLLNPQNVTAERQKRFKNEVLFCQRIEHPNVLKIMDDGPYLQGEKLVPFYIMQLYDSSLRELLKKGIKPDQVLPLFSQLLNGVEVAHLNKVVHRDLKPENFLYSILENRIVVADFGIARFQEENLYTAVETKSEDRLANFQYAAPEQRKRGAVADTRTDIYALGLILNEMFTGEIPQGTAYKTIESIASEYTYLDDLVASMIRQLPSDRPISIDAIKQELIGRKNDFIQRQQLSQLRNTVIPSSEIDDPLIAEPPQLISFDWGNGLLTLILNRPVNDKWIQTFYRIDWHQSLMGKDPHAFEFTRSKKELQVRAEERQVQDVINYFKPWIPTTNNDYKRLLEQEKKDQEDKLKRELESKISTQEARERLKKNIRI